MKEIERIKQIIADGEGRIPYGITVKAIEQYVIKAKIEENEKWDKYFRNSCVDTHIFATAIAELKKGLNQ